MEVTKKCRFITPFYGSAPAAGALATALNWIDDKITDGLLAWADKIKKKGEKAEDTLLRILSQFHRDENGFPVIGNWMIKRCLTNTGQCIFNAQKDKSHPKQDVIKHAILPVVPMPYVSIYNGKLIEVPTGIETYTVTTQKPKRSFFAAYEYVPKNTTFEFTASFDDNLISEKHALKIIEVAGRFGLGAFRERFGKFEYI
jgi:hypothetical protein